MSVGYSSKILIFFLFFNILRKIVSGRINRAGGREFRLCACAPNHTGPIHARRNTLIDIGVLVKVDRLATDSCCTPDACAFLTSVSELWSADILYEPRPRLSIRSRPRGPCFFSNVSRNLAPSLGLNAMKRMTGCSAGSPYARAIRKPNGVSPSLGAASAPPNSRTCPAPVNTAIATVNVCESKRPCDY